MRGDNNLKVGCCASAERWKPETVEYDIAANTINELQATSKPEGFNRVGFVFRHLGRFAGRRTFVHRLRAA
jgi:hypothetical protein